MKRWHLQSQGTGKREDGLNFKPAIFDFFLSTCRQHMDTRFGKHVSKQLLMFKSSRHTAALAFECKSNIQAPFRSLCSPSTPPERNIWLFGWSMMFTRQSLISSVSCVVLGRWCKQGSYSFLRAEFKHFLSTFKVPKPKISRLSKPLSSHLTCYYKCNCEK